MSVQCYFKTNPYLERAVMTGITRESGYGRYDVMLEPRTAGKDAIVLEFKSFNKRREGSSEDTLASALKQIEEKQYTAQLMARGIPAECIRSYGIAFQGKEVLIG